MDGHRDRPTTIGTLADPASKRKTHRVTMPPRPMVFKHNLRSVLSASAIPQLERSLQSEHTKTGEMKHGRFRHCEVCIVSYSMQPTTTPTTVGLSFQMATGRPRSSESLWCNSISAHDVS